MQLHEPKNFKVETPFVMDMDFDHKQDFTPAYVEPAFVFKDVKPIPKKSFFRQLLDLPKDIQELKTSQRTMNESMQAVERDVTQLSFRVDESERKINAVKDLSSSVDPLVTQVAELKMQKHTIQELTKSNKITKLMLGILVATNCVLMGLVYYFLLLK